MIFYIRRGNPPFGECWDVVVGHFDIGCAYFVGGLDVDALYLSEDEHEVVRDLGVAIVDMERIHVIHPSVRREGLENRKQLGVAIECDGVGRNERSAVVYFC